MKTAWMMVGFLLGYAFGMSNAPADANTHNHFANCHYAVSYPLSGEYAVRNRTTKNVYREQAISIIENNSDAISTNNLTVLGACR